jgi:hypothetical protein
MNNIKKFQYTTGDLFSLTGAGYYGYFNVLDGVGYIGKYTQEIPLQNIDSVRNIFALSDKFYNRLPTQNVTLSYKLSDFKFESNEYINNNSINVKLEKAYDNFLDCFKSCFMASSKLPYFLTRTAVLSNTNTSTRFVWVTGSGASTYIMSPSAILNSSSNVAFFKNTYSNNNTLVITNSSSLFTYTVNPTGNTFNLVFSSNKIDTTNAPGYGNISYGNITDMSKNGDYLYLTDTGRKKIYKYDVKSVLDEDRALKYKFNLIQSIDDTQAGFYQPQLIESSENNIFVYDSSNYTIYIYDNTFTLVNTYKNSKLFTVSPPVSLTYYKIYNQLYILTSDFKIVILDDNTNSNIVQLDTRGLQLYEVAKKLIFSNSNSDVFYVLSNKNIFKKFISNPTQNIGSYSFVNGITGYNTDIKGNVLYDIDTYESNKDYDDLIVFGYGQLLNYNEKTVFNSLIK